MPNIWSSKKRVDPTETDTWRLDAQTFVTEGIGETSKKLGCLVKPTVPIGTNGYVITFL